jgi:hypothetical protein
MRASRCRARGALFGIQSAGTDLLPGASPKAGIRDEAPCRQGGQRKGFDGSRFGCSARRTIVGSKLALKEDAALVALALRRSESASALEPRLGSGPWTLTDKERVRLAGPGRWRGRGRADGRRSTARRRLPGLGVPLRTSRAGRSVLRYRSCSQAGPEWCGCR